MTADSNDPSVFLVGYRGTGKTTVGRLLASRLGWAFVDTDELVERATALPISDLFAARGEAYFRDRESESLDEVERRLRSSGPHVVATGGGMVLRARNVERMQGLGRIAWLDADADTIRKRLEADPRTGSTRPGLTGASAVDEVEDVLRARLPLYRTASDARFVAELPAAQLCERLANWLQTFAGPAETS